MPWSRSVVLVGALALVCAVPADAQRTVGVKGGLSSARFTGSSLDRVEWARGMAGGLFVTAGIVDDLSFQAEAIYVRKGASISFTTGNVMRSGTLRVDYLEVPVLLRIDWPRNSSTSLHVMGGPAAAIRLKCSYIESDSADVECASGGLSLDVHTFDAGMLAGAGLDLNLNGVRIVTELRLAFGLMRVDAGEDHRRTNEAVTLLLGLGVPLSGGNLRAALR
jgi:hypothetical protein